MARYGQNTGVLQMGVMEGVIQLICLEAWQQDMTPAANITRERQVNWLQQDGTGIKSEEMISSQVRLNG